MAKKMSDKEMMEAMEQAVKDALHGISAIHEADRQ